MGKASKGPINLESLEGTVVRAASLWLAKRKRAGIAAYGFNPDNIRSIEREVAFKLIPRLKQS
jgi:hypothetical protein